MGFSKFIPYGDKAPYDVATTTQKEKQLWQELTMLRHVSSVSSINSDESTAALVDQAKIYFLDAFNSNWKSSGLLYYYSFLNLAKAYLVDNMAESISFLKSTSLYHGLSTEPQNPTNIIDFKIEMHPPEQNGKKNIFSQFYQKLMNEPWPFTKTISISISEIILHCNEISHEMQLFYNIQRESIDVLSLCRADQNTIWLELLIEDSKMHFFERDLGKHIKKIIPYSQINAVDRSDWSSAYGLTDNDMKIFSLVRINQMPYSNNNLEQFLEFKTEVDNNFKGFILPFPANDFNIRLYWHFIPKMKISNTLIKWHPLLSNYLFAFMLSSVLRYQPHLFGTGSKDSFIAEAWCNQSATTSLRYFLMEFSRQNLRSN